MEWIAKWENEVGDLGKTAQVAAKARHAWDLRTVEDRRVVARRLARRPIWENRGVVAAWQDGLAACVTILGEDGEKDFRVRFEDRPGGKVKWFHEILRG